MCKFSKFSGFLIPLLILQLDLRETEAIKTNLNISKSYGENISFIYESKIKLGQGNNPVLKSKVVKVPKCCSDKRQHVLVVGESSTNYKYICVNTSDYEDGYDHINFPHCDYTNSNTREGLIILDNRLDKWFEINNSSGQVEVGLNFWLWPAWLPVSEDVGQSCYDNVTFISIEDSSYSSNYSDVSQILLTCGLHGLGTYLTHRKLYGGLYMVSFVFVMLTCIIYWKTWSSQNTHGLAQLSFFIALALFYGTEGARILWKLNGLHIKPSKVRKLVCILIAVVAQYFFITVNTTSAILGFDLFWTLWKLDPSAYKLKAWKRIHIYNVTSWGTPFVGIVGGLIYNHYVSTDATRNESGLFEYAHYRCSSPLFESGVYAQITLYALNITFFITTSILICNHRRRESICSKRARKLLKEAISIHARLFFILGMTWIFVVVEFFFGQTQPLSYLWLFLRIVNSLMGLMYFILFGLNKKHVTYLKAKYYWFAGLTDYCMGDVPNPTLDAGDTCGTSGIKGSDGVPDSNLNLRVS